MEDKTRIVHVPTESILLIALGNCKLDAYVRGGKSIKWEIEDIRNVNKDLILELGDIEGEQLTISNCSLLIPSQNHGLINLHTELSLPLADINLLDRDYKLNGYALMSDIEE